MFGNLEMDVDGADEAESTGWVVLSSFSANGLFTGFGSVEVCVARVHFLIGTICVFNDPASSSPSRGNERGLVSSPVGFKEAHFFSTEISLQVERTFFILS